MTMSTPANPAPPSNRCPDELLAWYANGTLPAAERAEVETHLHLCPRCRHELEAWVGLRTDIQRMAALTPAPGPGVLTAIERRLEILDNERSFSRSIQAPSRYAAKRVRVFPRLRAIWQLLRAQRPLIRHDIWLASALVLTLGWLVSVMPGRSSGGTHGTLLVLFAPLVAAFGLSVLYGAENDVALELALATPTSPAQVLLARFVLVFGYDTLVTLLFSLGLKLVVPAVDLGHLLNLWLWPMFFLGTFALLLSLAVGTGTATLTSLLLWATLVFVVTEPVDQFHAGDALIWFWQTALPLGLLAIACFAGALLLTRRQEHFL